LTFFSTFGYAFYLCVFAEVSIIRVGRSERVETFSLIWLNTSQRDRLDRNYWINFGSISFILKITPDSHSRSQYCKGYHHIEEIHLVPSKLESCIKATHREEIGFVKETIDVLNYSIV
jgi:hypothetical protein